jgi:hypothetical protein
MSIRRVVPDIRSEALEESRDFYGRLGFVEVMKQGWVMTLASPSNPTAQITLMGPDATAAVQPDMSIEVDNVDALHAAMVERVRRSCTRCRTRLGVYAGSSSSIPMAASSTSSVTGDPASLRMRRAMRIPVPAPRRALVTLGVDTHADTRDHPDRALGPDASRVRTAGSRSIPFKTPSPLVPSLAKAGLG